MKSLDRRRDWKTTLNISQRWIVRFQKGSGRQEKLKGTVATSSVTNYNYSQEVITKISSLHSRLIFRRCLIRVTVCVHRNFYQRLKNELLHPTPLKMEMDCGRLLVRSSGPATFFRGDWSCIRFYGQYFTGADSSGSVVNYNCRKDVHLVLVNS